MFVWGIFGGEAYQKLAALRWGLIRGGLLKGANSRIYSEANLLCRKFTESLQRKEHYPLN